MLKALLMDMDDTLCDTLSANMKAMQVLANATRELFAGEVDELWVARQYLEGIYRNLDERYSRLLLPVTNERAFRLALIDLILKDAGAKTIPPGAAEKLQNSFDEARARYYDFFPSIKELLVDMRAHFTLVVITNGPEFSQLPKVEKVKLDRYVDHIIIGGQEKEEKPATSIFQKALQLAGCQPEEALHIGDSLKTDILGANNSNIRSVWISHGNDLDPSSGIKPAHIIENPFQIRELLHSLHKI